MKDSLHDFQPQVNAHPGAPPESSTWAALHTGETFTPGDVYASWCVSSGSSAQDTPPTKEGACLGGRLEPSHSKVTLAVRESRCRVRVCTDCGVPSGIRTRAILADRASLFQVPRLITFTVDRRGFSGPQEAYDAVRRHKLIARLLRFVHIKHWVCVVQFQEESGDGWPHWHILADVSHLPGRFIDFKRLWHLWRDTWQIGGLDVTSDKAKRVQSPLHAINYITRYLTHPNGAIPEWFLRLSRCRLVMASRSVGRLTDGDTSICRDRTTRRKRQPARPFVDRMAECRHRVNILQEGVDRHTGAIRYRFKASVPCRPYALVRASSGAAAERLPITWRPVVRVYDRRSGRVVIHTSEPVIDSADLELVKSFLSHPARLADVRACVDRRRDELLGSWALFQAEQQQADQCTLCPAVPSEESPAANGEPLLDAPAGYEFPDDDDLGC